MKPEGNYFLLNRALLEHQWLMKDRRKQLAWIYIIGRTNFNTGHVCLTEVYRELGDMFTNQQWRRFIKQCADRDMLSNIQTKNSGSEAGHVQTATVANYAIYQGKTLEKSVGADVGAVEGAMKEPMREPNPAQHNTTSAKCRSERHADEGAMKEPMSESDKELFKELKELNKNPPLPPQDQNLDPAHKTQQAGWGRMDNQILSGRHPNIWRLVCSLVAAENMTPPQIQQVAQKILSDVRHHGEPPVTEALDKTLLNHSSLRMPLAFYRSCLPSNEPQSSSVITADQLKADLLAQGLLPS